MGVETQTSVLHGLLGAGDARFLNRSEFLLLHSSEVGRYDLLYQILPVDEEGKQGRTVGASGLSELFVGEGGAAAAGQKRLTHNGHNALFRLVGVHPVKFRHHREIRAGDGGIGERGSRLRLVCGLLISGALGPAESFERPALPGHVPVRPGGQEILQGPPESEVLLQSNIDCLFEGQFSRRRRRDDDPKVVWGDPILADTPFRPQILRS